MTILSQILIVQKSWLKKLLQSEILNYKVEKDCHSRALFRSHENYPMSKNSLENIGHPWDHAVLSVTLYAPFVL